MINRFCIVQGVPIPKWMRENKLDAEVYAAGYILGRDGEEVLKQNNRLAGLRKYRGPTPAYFNEEMKEKFKHLREIFYEGQSNGDSLVNLAVNKSLFREETKEETEKRRKRDEAAGRREINASETASSPRGDAYSIMKLMHRNPQFIARELIEGGK